MVCRGGRTTRFPLLNAGEYKPEEPLVNVPTYTQAVKATLTEEEERTMMDVVAV